jgi:hypothetical protein
VVELLMLPVTVLVTVLITVLVTVLLTLVLVGVTGIQDVPDQVSVCPVVGVAEAIALPRSDTTTGAPVPPPRSPPSSTFRRLSWRKLSSNSLLVSGEPLSIRSDILAIRLPHL